MMARCNLLPLLQEEAGLAKKSDTHQRCCKAKKVKPPPTKKNNHAPCLNLFMFLVNHIPPQPKFAVYTDPTSRSFWRRFIFHAGILQHVCPFSAGACVTVFQMLPKMIRPEELFGLIALAELVYIGQMFDPYRPVGRHAEFFTAVATHVRATRRVLERRGMKCGLVA